MQKIFLYSLMSPEETCRYVNAHYFSTFPNGITIYHTLRILEHFTTKVV